MGGNRVVGAGFLAAAAALLVASPAVLKTAGVKDWRWLAAVAVMVPGAMLLAGIWKRRFEKAVESRESLAEELSKGTYSPGGKLPRVREITDPITIGVHPAPYKDSVAADGSRGDRVPVYVPRDVDERLQGELVPGGFVLLVGDSTAGKTRAAFEAMRAKLPDHTLIIPQSQDGVPSAVAKAATVRRCVLWLNDLQDYLGSGGLTRKNVIELLAGTDHHRVIVATLRAAEESRLIAGTEDQDTQQLRRESQAVLAQAIRIFLERHFSTSEQERAVDLAEEDPRIADALSHADTFGIAEYLACGPQLFAEWENAWAVGTHPRAAALIAAAVDIRRAGYTAPIPEILLHEVHTSYLERRGGARLRPEPTDDAWQWVTRPRMSGNAPLHTADAETYEVFDFKAGETHSVLVDGNGAHVPDLVPVAANGSPLTSDTTSVRPHT